MLLTAEADGAYIFIKDPGTLQQSESFVQMPSGFVGDDAIMPSAGSGMFFISNQGANDVIAVSIRGLNTNDIYADIPSQNDLVPLKGADAGALVANGAALTLPAGGASAGAASIASASAAALAAGLPLVQPDETQMRG